MQSYAFRKRQAECSQYAGKPTDCPLLPFFRMWGRPLGTSITASLLLKSP